MFPLMTVRVGSILLATAWLLLVAPMLSAQQQEPLNRWRLEAGPGDGWHEIPGSETLLEAERGRGFAKEGEGCLRARLRDSDADVRRGVESPSLRIKKSEKRAIRYHFWARGDGVRSLVVLGQNAKGDEFRTAAMPLPAGAWREFSVRPADLRNETGAPAEARALTLLQIFAGHDLEKKEALFWLDDVRVEPEPLPDDAANQTWPAPAAHPRLAAGLALDDLRIGPGDEPDVDRLRAACARLRPLGFGLLALPPMPWGDVENTRALFRFQYWDRLVQAARDQGLGVVVEFAFFRAYGAGELCLPADLEWGSGSGVLEARLERFLGLLVERYGESIRLFVFATTGAHAFEKGGTDAGVFLRLLDHGANVVHKFAPDVRVAAGANPPTDAGVVAKLPASIQVVGMKLDAGALGLQPGGTAEALRTLVKAGGGRRIALHAASYPSQGLAGSGPPDQGNFVRELLSGMRVGTIEWLTWAPVSDEIEDHVRAHFAGGPAQPWVTPAWITQRCNAGLISQDGKPKAAARVWAEGAATLPK